MQLFSKRNIYDGTQEDKTFLKPTLRRRIVQEIKYLSSCEKFFERCFLVHDKNEDNWFLDNESMSGISSRELGYDIVDFFNFRSFKIVVPDDAMNDYILFDLIEMLLIFSKEGARKQVRERFQKHFLEEGNEYKVYDFLIAKKDVEGVKPYVSFLKDKILRDKFEQYYTANLNSIKNFELLARISADILQFLFSAEKKDKTKKYSSNLVQNLAAKIVDKPDICSFAELLNKTVLNIKDLNNQISNIRHTDKHTLLVDNLSIFRLITANNIYIAEMVVLADPENYFFSQKAIDVKNDYIQNYNIPVTGWIIPKHQDVNVDDIPF